jgi:LysM repeat protein
VLTLVAPALANLSSPAAVPTNAPAVVVVQPGDTLWSIARRIAPDRDARLVVADLRRLNALPSADLEVGQRLQVRAG